MGKCTVSLNLPLCACSRHMCLIWWQEDRGTAQWTRLRSLSSLNTKLLWSSRWPHFPNNFQSLIKTLRKTLQNEKITHHSRLDVRWEGPTGREGSGVVIGLSWTPSWCWWRRAQLIMCLKWVAGLVPNANNQIWERQKIQSHEYYDIYLETTLHNVSWANVAHGYIAFNQKKST